MPTFVIPAEVRFAVLPVEVRNGGISAENRVTEITESRIAVITR